MKIFDVNWHAVTAGPSPDKNQRTEIFLLGCEKAMSGNPCKGCFNKATWDASLAKYEHDPKDAALNAIKFSPNKYVTIGGGEPTDQIEDLLVFTKILKEHDYHIMMYTWRSLYDIIEGKYGDIFKSQFIQLIQQIDILVDGEFIPEQKLYIHDSPDGLFGSVGSGNQIIWDLKNSHQSFEEIIGFKMECLDSIGLSNKDELFYALKQEYKIEKIQLGGK